MISSQTLLKETFPCTLGNLRAFEGTEGSNVQLKSQILGTLVNSGLDLMTFSDGLALS